MRKILAVILSLSLISPAFAGPGRLKGWGVQKPPLGTQINPDHPLSKGLLAMWVMNEYGGNVIHDSTGLNNNGTFSASTIIWQPGKFGTAIYIPSGQKIDCGPLSGIANQVQITYVMWFNKGALQRAAIGKGTVGSNSCNMEAYSDGRVYLEPTSSTSGYGDFPYAQDGKWNQLVMVFNGNGTSTATKLQGYFNAIPQVLSGAVSATATGSDTGDFFIGSNIDIGATTTSYIDDVMIYNRALSANEVAQLYRDPFCMFNSPRYFFIGPAPAAAPGGSFLPHFFGSEN